MYNPLTNLPARVVIDANILLDAAFVKDGAAKKALFSLPEIGYTPIIDRAIESEARRILRKYNLRYCPNIDLSEILGDAISTVPVLSLPTAPQISSDSVNKHDVHVLSAAVEYCGWVLSGDLDLHLELVPHGIETRVPYDVVMSTQAHLTLDSVVRMVAPTRESGMIFGRGSGQYWPESRSRDQYTFCDLENVGRLYYDNGTKEWVFEMRVGNPVRIECPIANNELWSACGSYRLPGNGGSGIISIMAGRHPDIWHRASVKTSARLSARSVGKSTFGHSIAGGSHWNGQLQAIVVGPQGVSKDSWKKIIRIQFGAPNPYDSGMLERVFQSVGSANSPSIGEILLPTEQDIRRLDL